VLISLLKMVRLSIFKMAKKTKPKKQTTPRKLARLAWERGGAGPHKDERLEPRLSSKALQAQSDLDN